LTTTFRPAKRESVGLIIGIAGPSGSGKSYSSMRLAKGISGEKPYAVIDTENGRALHYAEKFKFTHVRFGAPFSPMDYLEAIRFCARRGSKTVIVDSFSHEHDGPGGVLEMHDAEVQRLAGDDYAKQERVKYLAWSKPKAMRKRLINEVLQLNINLIATFRAKEKLKIQRGKDPIELGWMPICGDEFMYEMALQCLLKPGCIGVPSWESEFDGERAVMKLPDQFEALFGEAKQLDEDLGQRLAEWAAGGARPSPEQGLIADYAKCATREEFNKLETARKTLWDKTPPLPHALKQRIKDASDLAADRLR